MEQEARATVHALYVGNQSNNSGLSATSLERECDSLTFDGSATASEGLERLATEEYDCVVSNLERAGNDGLEFLDAVRAEYPELPFILITDVGNDGVVEEAFARNVTDYIPKNLGGSIYTVLANRIQQAVEKYRTRQRLTAQNNQYQNLFEQAPVMYAATRNRAGTPIIVDCNEEFLSRLGHAREDVIGEPLAEFYTEDSAQTLYGEGYERALSDDFETEERRFVTADGEELETLLRAVPRRDENGKKVGTLTLYIDITERKRREQRLKRERDRLEAMFDAAPYPVAHVRIDDDEPIVDRVSDEFEEVFGFTQEQIQGDSLDEYIVPDEKAFQAVDINEQAQETAGITREVVRETAAGEQREFLFAAATVEVGEGTVEGIGTYVDITDRNRRIEQLERIKRNVSDVVWISSPEKDRMEFVSDSYEDVWGRSPESLKQDPMSSVEAIHPDDRDRVKAALEAQSENPDDYEETYRVIKPGGDIRWVHDRSSGIYEDGELEGVIGVAHDITDRKRRERELQRERAFIDQALDTLDDVFYVVGTDGTLRRWNARLAEVTGYSDERIDGMSAVEFFCEDDRGRIAKAIEEALETGLTVVEAEFLTADGDRRPYEFTGARLTDPDGELIGLVGIGRDISERKERERELRTFQEAVENAGHAIFWTDADGTIEYANPAFEEQTGYTLSEAIGETPAILNSNVQSEEFHERMWETIQNGERWEAEFVNRRKNGERYIVNQSITPVSQAGEIDRYVTVAADISERYQREQQLSVLQRVLRHDLRNNLNEILLATQLLSRDIDGSESLEHLDAIQQTVEETLSLARKVRDFWDVFERNENYTKELDLADRTRTQISSLTTERPAVDFSVDLPSEANAVTNELIDQAIRNVLQNAVEHNDRETPEIDVTLERQRDGNEIALCIADNGPGIPQTEIDVLESDEEEQLQHLSGFGLWLVNWVVALSGGDLKFEANDPRGTVVKLVFPSVDRPTASS